MAWRALHIYKNAFDRIKMNILIQQKVQNNSQRHADENISMHNNR